LSVLSPTSSTKRDTASATCGRTSSSKERSICCTDEFDTAGIRPSLNACNDSTTRLNARDCLVSRPSRLSVARRAIAGPMMASTRPNCVRLATARHSACIVVASSNRGRRSTCSVHSGSARMKYGNCSISRCLAISPARPSAATAVSRIVLRY
jgi:hypothetical protein